MCLYIEANLKRLCQKVNFVAISIGVAGLLPPSLKRHRMYSQHSGYGSGYGDNHFQDGFPSVFSNLHNVSVFL